MWFRVYVGALLISGCLMGIGTLGFVVYAVLFDPLLLLLTFWMPFVLLVPGALALAFMLTVLAVPLIALTCRFRGGDLSEASRQQWIQRCGRCGYDVGGLTNDSCPECGQAIVRSSEVTR